MLSNIDVVDVASKLAIGSVALYGAVLSTLNRRRDSKLGRMKEERRYKATERMERDVNYARLTVNNVLVDERNGQLNPPAALQELQAAMAGVRQTWGDTKREIRSWRVEWAFRRLSRRDVALRAEPVTSAARRLWPRLGALDRALRRRL